MTTITLNTTPQQEKLLQTYAEEHHTTIADFLLSLALERLEDEEDARLADQAYAEYLANPVTYTLQEVADELGIAL